MKSERFRNGARGPRREGSRLIFASSLFLRSARGFTLLEMIMVLVILAILAGLSLPSVESAFTEQAVRKDTHQLALMVKTAMIQSADQHRAYEIDLSATQMALHPVGEAAADPDATDDTTPAADTAGDTSTDATKPVDVVVTTALDPANKLMGPDPLKADSWIAIPTTTWIFQPGELCPATRVRFERGTASVELSFDALTGNVVDETSSIP